MAEPTARTGGAATDDPRQLITRLRELIDALEARVPHLERQGEVQIVADATALKAKALNRIARLEQQLTSIT